MAFLREILQIVFRGNIIDFLKSAVKCGQRIESAVERHGKDVLFVVVRKGEQRVFHPHLVDVVGNADLHALVELLGKIILVVPDHFGEEIEGDVFLVIVLYVFQKDGDHRGHVVGFFLHQRIGGKQHPEKRVDEALYEKFVGADFLFEPRLKITENFQNAAVGIYVREVVGNMFFLKMFLQIRGIQIGDDQHDGFTMDGRMERMADELRNAGDLVFQKGVFLAVYGAFQFPFADVEDLHIAMEMQNGRIVFRVGEEKTFVRVPEIFVFALNHLFSPLSPSRMTKNNNTFSKYGKKRKPHDGTLKV